MESILNDPKFQESLAAIAKENELEMADAQAKAAEYIKELHAQQHPLTKMISVKGFDYLLSRAYNEKIDVDPEGIKKLMRLMRQHSVAFIMTHKTYLDTLVLISTLARFGMPVPYSFGGINLAFPVLKQLGNSAGLIFIRRSFKENPIYKLSLRHYIATIINNGDHLTWNIEGTRSRTGKILHPQMGILKYIMDAEQESTKKIKYVPVSISYDLIPDVKEMTEQAKGDASKKSENVAEAIKYIRRLGNNFGRAAIRFGDPVEVDDTHQVTVPHLEENSYQNKNTLPFFAFDLINQMSKITPVSTVSLISNVLLNDFALTKKEIEFKVKKLMEYIGKKQPNSLIDRGISISASVQKALNLLQSAHIVQKSRAGQKAQYSIVASEYLVATYYANMVAGHLYHTAFVEMALIKIKDDTSSDRIVRFWEEIMRLRNLFKFEFFYTSKAKFSSEIEEVLQSFDKKWREILLDPQQDVTEILKKQDLFISRALLLSYLEADKVVCYTLNNWDEEDPFSEEEFLELCMFRGKELHWQSRITRLGSVSKPFLSSALQFAENAGLGIKDQKVNSEGLEEWMEYLEDLSSRLGYLKDIEVQPSAKAVGMLSTQKMLVPAAKTKPRKAIENEEEGPHIAAYFDLDRTLINDFSAKRFVRTRLFSGDSSATELVSQFMTALFFSFGNRDFEFLSKVSALGVKGIPEQVFAELGQYVFEEFLAN
ncbi:MAG: 1-acyl-sn-glycerol-3-phosphate acyltransferase, partial [Bacteroidota bacterium]